MQLEQETHGQGKLSKETTPLHCIIWHTEGTAISGLLSWMHRLKTTLPEAGVRLELASMEIQPFRFSQVAPIDGFYDYRIRTGLELVAFLKKNRGAIHLINHAFDYVELAAKLNGALLAQSHLVGICHTDQEYYYHNIRKIGAHLRGVIAVSSICAGKLEQIFPQWNGVIPILPAWDMPIPPPQTRDVSSGKPLRLLFNGRILQLQKRVLDIPPLLADLNKRGVPVELTIAGDGPDLPKLQAALKKQNASNIRFTGPLPPWEMDDLLDQHDLFLQLSEFEGASVSLMEAMLHSLVPVVTLIDSGIDLLKHGHNALLSKIGDSADMAAKIELLHRHRDMIPPLTSEAYKTASTHLRELNYPEKFAAYLRTIKS